MTSHGVARPTTTPTPTQLAAEQTKITTYTTLSTSLREHLSLHNYTHTPEALALTTKILRLNPEYYTIWNVRRRLLTDGLLSRRRPGSSASTASRTISATNATTASSESYSSSGEGRGGGIPPSRGGRGIGRGGGSGLIVEGEGAGEGDMRTEGDKDNDAAQDLPVLQSELHFTIPLLLASPKCYWIWNYRRYILSESISRLSTPVARQIWLEELALDSKMLTKDRRNFHAWGYRRYLVQMLESPELDGSSMVESEFKFTTDKIKGDLSNFSAWHARSRLIPRLLEERGMDGAGRRGFFDSELNFIHEALNVGPEDQSLWFYHQFLMASLTPNEKGREYAIVTDFSSEDRIAYLTREIEEIKELAEDYDDVKWIYEALMEYTIALGELREFDDEEREHLRGWLGRLRVLDPMRRGRWDDVEGSWKL